MASQTTPKRPVEDWEAVRDEWVAAVEQLIDETERWALQHDWGTLRDTKTITEDRLGEYTVPRLLIHTMAGRLLLDPVSRYVVGAEGLVDFCAYPSWDGEHLARMPDGWYLYPGDADEQRFPWNDETLVEAARRLAPSS